THRVRAEYRRASRAARARMRSPACGRRGRTGRPAPARNLPPRPPAGSAARPALRPRARPQPRAPSIETATPALRAGPCSSPGEREAHDVRAPEQAHAAPRIIHSQPELTPLVADPKSRGEALLILFTAQAGRESRRRTGIEVVRRLVRVAAAAREGEPRLRDVGEHEF